MGSFDPRAGVEPAIGDVDQQVEKDEDGCVENDDSHHEAIVAIDRALHEEAADAGQREDLLHDDRPGDDVGRDRPQIAHDGQEGGAHDMAPRSEEHTSELQSLMRISYAVFCLKKKKQQNTKNTQNNSN